MFLKKERKFNFADELKTSIYRVLIKCIVDGELVCTSPIGILSWKSWSTRTEAPTTLVRGAVGV